MKKSLIFLTIFSLCIPAYADGLFGLFRRRQQVQLQAVQCYQPTYQVSYRQAVTYQAVAAVPLATVPVAVDLQAYLYSVNSGAFQSFREYQTGKNSAQAEPSEVTAPVAPQVADDSPALGVQVLQKNCLTCHTAGKNPKSNFSIFDKQGNLYAQLPWQEMMSRISSHDPSVRMPPKKTLPTSDIMAVFNLASGGLTSAAQNVQTASSSKVENPFD